MRWKFAETTCVAFALGGRLSRVDGRDKRGHDGKASKSYDPAGWFIVVTDGRQESAGAD